MIDNPSDHYTCLHTISLAENVDSEAFEQTMMDEIMPRTHVSRRTIAKLSLDHRLLKSIHNQGGEQYIWQIRASNLEMVSREPDYEWLIGQIEEDVRQALTPWGNVDDVSAFQEIGGVDLP